MIKRFMVTPQETALKLKREILSLIKRNGHLKYICMKVNRLQFELGSIIGQNYDDEEIDGFGSDYIANLQDSIWNLGEWLEDSGYPIPTWENIDKEEKQPEDHKDKKAQLKAIIDEITIN